MSNKSKGLSANQWLIIAGIAGVASLIGFVLLISIFRPYKVMSDNMYPTIKAGQRAMTRKSRGVAVKHGDIIIFRGSETSNQEEQFFARAVGLPGDRVAFKDGSVIVTKPDGETYKPYADYIADISEELTVPDGSLYVMNDNQQFFGPSSGTRDGLVKLENVDAKYLFAYP